MDVNDRKAVNDSLLKFDERFPIDILIANAGVSASTCNSTGDEEKAFFEVFETNSVCSFIFSDTKLGVANCIVPLIPRMKQRKKGQLVIMGSLASDIGPVGGNASASAHWLMLTILRPLLCLKSSNCKHVSKLENSTESLWYWCYPYQTWLCENPIDRQERLLHANDDKCWQGRPGTTTFWYPKLTTKIMVDGIAKDYAVVAYPSLMFWGVWALRLIPQNLISMVLRKWATVALAVHILIKWLFLSFLSSRMVSPAGK